MDLAEPGPRGRCRMGAGFIRTLASFAHLYFVFFLSHYYQDLHALGGWQSRKPHRILFVKNCVDAESIFELVGLCPAHDKMGVWEELGAGS